jgi:hypothetical protein
MHMQLSSSSSLRYLLAACVYFCISPVMPAGAESEDVLRQRVLTMWRNRQDAIKSLRLSWTEQRTDTKGAFYRRIDDAYVALPLEDTTYKGDCSLLVQGRSSFYEYRGKTLRRVSFLVFPFDGPPALYGRTGTRAKTKSDFLPVKYIDPQKSGLQVIINEHGNHLELHLTD